MITYFATVSLTVAKMLASSRTRCGRLPVFSSCSMAETTTSSLIPSVSILRGTASRSSLSGDGGGVGSCAARVAGDCCPSTGSCCCLASTSGGGDNESCDRLTFLDGGDWSSTGLDMEGERCEEREAVGRLMPREGRESDLRRVL